MDNNLNNDYEVRLATLAAMEGDMTKEYSNIFEVDKEILKQIEGGAGGGAKIDDNNTSTGTVWSSSKTSTEINKGQNVLVLEEGEICTQEIFDKFKSLWYGDPEKSLCKLAAFMTIQGHQVIAHPINVNVEFINYNVYMFGAIVENELYQAEIHELTVGSEITFNNKQKIGYVKINDSLATGYSVWSSSKTSTEIASKQDTLVSGTNIKTINNNSILGAGNIQIQGGSGVIELTQAQYEALTTKDPTIIYNITDATPYVMEDYATTAALTSAIAALSTVYNPYNTTTSRSAGYLPQWNDRGQITGYGSYLYQSSGSINGTSQTFYRTTSASLPNIYAPTTAGTAGQVLLSSGNGAPVWTNFKSDATAYIAEADCSAGTYSTDIQTFYSECIQNQKIGPMQLTNTTAHTVKEVGDPALSFSANDQFAIEAGQTASFTSGTSTISIAADGTISDPDATGAISADQTISATGYFTYKANSAITVSAGTAYEIEENSYNSYSYYYPSSTRLYEGNVELWFFTTENGQTWRNLHILMTNTTVSADATEGTFGTVSGFDDENVSPQPF